MPLPKFLRRIPVDRVPRGVRKFLHYDRKAFFGRPAQDGMDDAVAFLGVGAATVDVVKEAP